MLRPKPWHMKTVPRGLPEERQSEPAIFAWGTLVVETRKDSSAAARDTPAQTTTTHNIPRQIVIIRFTSLRAPSTNVRLDSPVETSARPDRERSDNWAIRHYR